MPVSLHLYDNKANINLQSACCDVPVERTPRLTTPTKTSNSVVPPTKDTRSDRPACMLNPSLRKISSQYSWVKPFAFNVRKSVRLVLRSRFTLGM